MMEPEENPAPERRISAKKTPILSQEQNGSRTEPTEQKSELLEHGLSSIVSPLRRRVRWGIVLSIPIVALAIFWPPLRTWVFVPLTLLTLFGLGWVFISNIPKADDPKKWGALRRLVWCLFGCAQLIVVVYVLVAPFRAGPLRSPARHLSKDWWWFPIERNTWLRADRAQFKVHSFSASENGRDLWATGNGGLLLESTDSGQTWQSRRLATTNNLRSLSFADASRGSIAGDNGTLLFTGDGGRAWSPSTANEWISNYPWSWKQLVLDRTGFGVCLDNSGFNLAQTSDFGTNWTRVDLSANSANNSGSVPYDTFCLVPLIPQNSFANSLAPIQKQSQSADSSSEPRMGIVLAARTNLCLYSRPNQSSTWGLSGCIPLANDDRQAVLQMLPLSSNHVAIVTSAGRLQAANLLSGELLPPPKNDSFKYREVIAEPKGGLWGVNSNGEVVMRGAQNDLLDTNMAASIRVRLTNEPAELHLSWAGTNGLFAFGGGKVLHWENGFSWQTPLLPHRALPAPIAWLSSALILLAAVALAFFTPATVRDKKSEASFPITDRPIDDPEDDQLGFGPLADGLATFIKNPATKPPWVIAVTGEWGTGKSSLMGMVRKHLRDGAKFPTVWFNAWHYQNEEHILPPLLRTVVREGVPGWFQEGAWMYRRRLWQARASEDPWQTGAWISGLLAVTVLLILIAIPLADGRRTITAEAPQATPMSQMSIQARNRTNVAEIATILRDGLEVQWVTPSASPQTSAEGLDTLPILKDLRSFFHNRVWWGKWVAVLLPLIGICYKAWTALKSFGLEPKSLVARAGSTLHNGEIDVSVSIQQRFAKQFREVTVAMDDRQLVIFIDDLDRCQPQKVAQMLEAINFLTVSGNCFVVLGFARDQVEAAVGLGFREMAAEMQLLTEERKRENERRAKSSQPLLPSISKTELDRENRLAFARKYLKKLINMEVAVPTPDNRKMAAMLYGGKLPTGNGEAHPPRRIETTSARGVAKYAVATVLGLFALAALAHPLSALEIEQNAPSNTQAAQNSIIPNSPQQQKLSPLSLGSTDRQPWWIVFPSLLTVWVFLVVREFPVRNRFREPEELGRALLVWTPWIRPCFPTAREGKRYVNLVRYVVMRALEERRLLDPNQENGGLKPEDAVYASAAYFRPRPSQTSPDATEFDGCLARHQQVLHSTPSSDARESFERFSREVRVN